MRRHPKEISPILLTIVGGVVFFGSFFDHFFAQGLRIVDQIRGGVFLQQSPQHISRCLAFHKPLYVGFGIVQEVPIYAPVCEVSHPLNFGLHKITFK